MSDTIIALPYYFQNAGLKLEVNHPDDGIWILKTLLDTSKVFSVILVVNLVK